MAWIDIFLIACFIMSGVGIILLIRMKPLPDTKRVRGSADQQMLFQGTSLRWLDEQMSQFNRKVSDRSLEIAKTDGRFLVTPDDMKKAYDEIVREEHM